MKGLYEVYHEKAHDEVVGHIWLDQKEMQRMRQYGRLQLLVEEGVELMAGPVPPMPYAQMSLNTITIWLDCSADRSSRGKYVYRVYTDAEPDMVKRAREAQERFFRSPVPISLFPG